MYSLKNYLAGLFKDDLSNDMNVTQYLHRIEIDQIEEPSTAFLEKLQHHHLVAVPFENLDILQGKKIILDESRIYEKVVVHKRGGFCYELNGLFYWLLRELGFSARVYQNKQFSPELDHMVLLIALDKTYLVDVGFGDSYRKPITVPDGEIEDCSGKYRIMPLPSAQNEHRLQRQDKGKWIPEYSFTTVPRRISDFAERCVFSQTSSESHFTHGTVCTIATEEGRVTLSDNYLTITEGTAKRKIAVSSPEKYRQYILEYFGIELGND